MTSRITLDLSTEVPMFTITNSATASSFTGTIFDYNNLEFITEGGIKSFLEDILYFGEDEAKMLTQLLFTWTDSIQSPTQQ